MEMWRPMSGNGVLQWLGDLIARCLLELSSSETRRGKLLTALLTYLHLRHCINGKLHCARPIPRHGYDHTLFPQGVSVASFRILFQTMVSLL